MATYLGIDLGTSAVKTLLIDEDQRIVGRATASQIVLRPAPGYSEQDPAAWWQAAQATLDQLAAEHPQAMAAVEGIGLSGQQHGATLLDAADQVLRPAILWNDARSEAECRQLTAAVPGITQLAGSQIMAGFTAPKLLWVKAHEPAIFARVARVLLPKDYLRLCLTGEAVSEFSDASGTGWLDVGQRAWSPAMLAGCDMDESFMPRLVEGCEVSAQLRPALAERWGIAKPPVVAGGGGDNAAAACGIGAVREGTAFVSIGTSGVIFAPTARFQPNPEEGLHSFCHALPGLWHQMAVLLAATDSLEWLARLTGQAAPALVAALGAAPKGPGRVLFAPYLSGDRSPHNDPSVRGAVTGIDGAADGQTLTQAVLEGVSFALADGLAAMERAGTAIETLTAVGGGARSAWWLQLLAHLFDRPVTQPADSEVGSALGAARLGMAAATGTQPFAPAEAARVYTPEPSLATAYREAWQRWQALYPAIAPLSRALA